MSGYYKEANNASEETYDQTWWGDDWGEACWANGFFCLDYDWYQWGSSICPI